MGTVTFTPWLYTLKFLAPELFWPWEATDGTRWASAGAAFYHDLLERRCNELLDSLRDYRELARYRRGLGLTQAELARRAGVSKSLVCMVEVGGRRMTDDVVEKLWRVIWKADQERKANGTEVLVRLEKGLAVITEVTRMR
jgi:DNA-binding XRE family transcriptional regulator